MSGCPFALLGINRDGASEKSVLKAWRRRMRENHSDKHTVDDDSVCQALNDAKERALADLLMGVGKEDWERVEEATGIRINEDRLDDAWEILTGQRSLGSDLITAEQNPTAAKWMDKSVFRRDIFRMMGFLRR
jgi:hypothetical protein